MISNYKDRQFRSKKDELEKKMELKKEEQGNVQEGSDRGFLSRHGELELIQWRLSLHDKGFRICFAKIF